MNQVDPLIAGARRSGSGDKSHMPREEKNDRDKSEKRVIRQKAVLTGVCMFLKGIWKRIKGQTWISGRR